MDAVFIEDSGNCTARQQYVGLIAATGTNLAAGGTLQQCASASLAALSSISLTATGTVIEPAPDPGPDPVPGRVFTLTVVLAGSGSGTVASSPAGINCGSDCTETYPEGTAATLTPTSAAGSVFAGWSGDAACANGAVAMDVDHSCTATFNTSTRPSFTLTITVGGSGSGSVASNPGGITRGGDCTEDYTEGTVVTLTPTAAAGSIFGGWTGHPDCSDGQVTMNAARHRTATFDVSTAPTKTLTVTRAGTGSGTVTSSPGGISCGGDCSEDYREGTAVTLIPTANAGSTFVGWSGAVDCSDGSVTTSPAGVNCGAGCTESYEEGTIVTLIHNPAGGSTFAGWSGGADCVDGSVTMNGTRSCIATFDLVPPNTLAVTVTGTGLGTVTSDVGGINCPGTCSAMYPPVPPVTVTLTATPGVNSTFGGWTGDCSGMAAMTSVTVNVARGCTATFTQITRTLSVARTDSGTGTLFSSPPGISCGVTCMAQFDQGPSSVTLTAVPGFGSAFGSWSGDCGGTNLVTNVTMNAAKSCIATFVQQHQLDVTVTLTGGATGSVMFGTTTCTTGTCGEMFDQGTVVTLTATTADTFGGWGGACAGAGTNLQAMVTMNSAQAYTATFDP